MSVTVECESPQIITVRMRGKVSSEEWREELQKVAKHLDTLMSSSILVIAEDFAGFGQGDWTDLSFQLAHDRQINRMAIVTDPKFEDEALLFAGKGLRRFEIQYFPPSQLAAARAWLLETSKAST